MGSSIKKKPLGRPPKRENQRDRILLEAARLFAIEGYETCTLDSVARKLELTRPALYHYFATKQAIITEITLTIVREMYEHVRERVDDKASPTDQLRMLMLAHAEYFESNYWMMAAGVIGYGGIARRELTRLDEIQRYRAAYEKLLLSIIRQGIRSGEFRNLDVKATALAVFQLLNVTYWYRPGGKRSAVEFAADNYALLIGGIRAAGPGHR